MKLDVGCGNNKRPGYIGMDISSKCQPEFVHDWEDFPWPFEDNSIEAINAAHVLEHTKDLIRFMDECYRILQPGGKMDAICPYHTSTGAWQDPTHIRAISEATFNYFSKDWRKNNGLAHYPITSDFSFSYIHLLDDKWLNKPQEEIQFGIQHYFNVCRFICVEFTKR
jgi:ubiquinone/menaquinone biosynthesis C-methylase UbiE